MLKQKQINKKEPSTGYFQSKLLDKDYIKSILNNYPEIRNKQVIVSFSDSNRIGSCSLYIIFSIPRDLDGEKFLKGKTIRISDHITEKSPYEEIIIKPYEILKVGQKRQFIKLLEHAICSCKKKAEVTFIRKLNIGGYDVKAIPKKITAKEKLDLLKDKYLTSEQINSLTNYENILLERNEFTCYDTDLTLLNYCSCSFSKEFNKMNNDLKK